jgi:hypothetical protein
MDTPEEQNPESLEVVAVEMDVDGRPVEYILTDIILVRDQRYATLFSEDEFIDPQDRTVFAKIVETETGDEQFELLQDDIELDMVVANATVSALEDMLSGMRFELFQMKSLLGQTDFTNLPDSQQQVLGVVYTKCTNLLEMLDEEDLNTQESEDDEQ